MVPSIHKIVHTCKYWYTKYIQVTIPSVRSICTGYISYGGENIVRDCLRTGIVVCVGVACYGFALTGTHAAPPTLDTTKRVPYMNEHPDAHNATARVADTGSSLPAGSTIVASKNGTKYHYVWCSSARRIALKNRRYFIDAAAAERAGYTRASTCAR